MNYKKIIKSQKHRFFILRLVRFIPDNIMLKIQYRIKTGRKLNIKNPKRYTEKLQWYKLYYRDSLMITCSDKFKVRDYVESKGLSEILNSLYGIYNKPHDIDFSTLPEQFVLKSNNGGGGNNVILCDDKSNLNEENTRNQLSSWLEPRISSGREWVYEKIEPKIIAERLLPRDENNDIPDFKFFCFNGKVEYLYVMINYVDSHNKGQCSFYTRDFQQLDFRRSEFAPINKKINKPKNFDKMINYAEKLSEDFPHVRVDFYNIKGQIIFGELTFFNASGYTKYTPDEFDFIMGNQFKLPNERIK